MGPGRFLSPMVLLALAGCASASPSGSSAQPPASRQPAEVAFESGTLVMNVQAERRVFSHTVSDTPDRVWIALGAAWEALGIPVATVDRRARILGNRGFAARGQVGGTRMTDLLDCGFGMSGPIAGQNRITFSIHSQVRPAPDGTSQVQSIVEAVALPVEGTSNNPLPCTSTGALEALIVEKLEAALGR